MARAGQAATLFAGAWTTALIQHGLINP